MQIWPLDWANKKAHVKVCKQLFTCHAWLVKAGGHAWLNSILNLAALLSKFPYLHTELNSITLLWFLISPPEGSIVKRVATNSKHNLDNYTWLPCSKCTRQFFEIICPQNGRLYLLGIVIKFDLFHVTNHLTLETCKSEQQLLRYRHIHEILLIQIYIQNGSLCL